MAASVSADYGFYRAQYHNASVSAVVATADSATTTPITVKSARHSIFLQRITMSVTTDNAATLTFQDTASSPVVVAKSPASPGLGLEVVCDFGPEGFQLTEGKNLQMVISGAGLGCVVSYEAYQRVTAVSATL